MNKQKRRIFLFAMASLATLGLALVSTGKVSARRGSPNCWGEKEETKSGQEYRDYITEIRGTDHYEFIPCPTCGSNNNSGGGGNGNQNRDDDDDDHRSKPKPCTPRYAAPTLSGTGQDPPYPLTLGQDPDNVGVELTYAGRGGRKTNSCNRGPGRSSIRAFEIVSVNLTDETVDWINGELADTYPGARVKDNYPFVPSYTTSGIGSTSASLTAHIDPLDPGEYTVRVRLAQADGKAVVRNYTVKVWLLEAAITGP
mgnify:CR=1 FL=1